MADETEKGKGGGVTPVISASVGRTMKAEGGTFKLTGGVGSAWVRPPDDHPVYAKIGLVTANWSQVEKVLDEIIWWLVDKHDRRIVACLTGQFAGTFQRHNAIIALLLAKGVLTPELRARIERERGACNNTSAKRNRIVHDAWQVNVEDASSVAAHRSWPKEDLRFGISEIPDGEFDGVLKSINNRLVEAVALRNDLNPLLA
jgi:hypothetical protein